MTEKLFETALGVATPWFVAEADFKAAARRLTIRIDFTPGSRFAVSGAEGEHPVHDTVSKPYWPFNFFQHICSRYVDLALAQADFFAVQDLAMDDTSRARRHDYVTLAADADRRAVSCVTEG